jgi:Spy/CpxP family protein refolding chaperone
MKKPFCRIALSGLLAAGLTFGAASAIAQDAAPSPSAGGSAMGGRMGRMPSPDDQLAQMTKRYNLSADQQSQIKPILTDRAQQMMTLRQDQSMSREDKMAKMKSMRDDSNTKINAILNDTQKKQFADDQAKMQERMQQRMQQGGGGGPQ